eukprot:6657409-Lingulodinium_polyedra.AAC.1
MSPPARRFLASALHGHQVLNRLSVLDSVLRYRWNPASCQGEIDVGALAANIECRIAKSRVQRVAVATVAFARRSR